MKLFDGKTGQVLDEELDREAVIERLQEPYRLCKLSDKGLKVVVDHQSRPEYGDNRRPRSVVNREQRAERRREAAEAALDGGLQVAEFESQFEEVEDVLEGGVEIPPEAQRPERTGPSPVTQAAEAAIAEMDAEEPADDADES